MCRVPGVTHITVNAGRRVSRPVPAIHSPRSATTAPGTRWAPRRVLTHLPTTALSIRAGARHQSPWHHRGTPGRDLALSASGKELFERPAGLPGPVGHAWGCLAH
jgi:hypothetical protein